MAALTAVAVPNYEKYVERAKTKHATADIFRISLEVEHYYNANDSYPGALSALNAAIPKDPWGHAYQYLAIDVSPAPAPYKIKRDESLHPLNSDFDLYSLGPDGKTTTQVDAQSSRDDIIRAGNGGYIGPASEF